jgi:signal transduction histidine kinase
LLRRHIARDRDALETLTKVETGIQSLDSMVNDLLHFTADREPKLSQCPIIELVDDVVASLQLQLAAQAVVVERSIPETLIATVDRDMLRRAVLNLSLNAVDAMPNGGRLIYTTIIDGDCFELSVADTGAGLNEESLRRAFEPFYTTKNTGTGLGLAIVWRVAEVHGGMCLVANQSGGGAVFTLRLPINRQEAAS